MNALVQGLKSLVFGLLAPHECPGCQTTLPSHVVFCGDCAAAVLPIRACGTDGAFAGFDYGGPVAQSIRRYKYGPDRTLGTALARAFVWAVTPLSHAIDCVMPVPLARERLAERGFNQVAPLAGALAEAIGARFACHWLARRRATVAQASLDAKQRRALLDDNPFVATRSLRGLRIAVCDDVVTTGSTLLACEAALLRAGAARVIRVALARAD